MNQLHMTYLPDKLKELERKKWSCDWDKLQYIHEMIADCKNKLSLGIEYEPDF